MQCHTVCWGLSPTPQSLVGPFHQEKAFCRIPRLQHCHGSGLRRETLVSNSGALKGPVALASTFTGRLSSKRVHRTDGKYTLPWLCLVSPDSHLNSQWSTVSSWLSDWNAWKIWDGIERTCNLHRYSKVHTPWELHSGTILSYVMDYFCLQKQVTNNSTK